MQNTYLFPWGMSSWLFVEDEPSRALEKLAAAGVEWVELWANTCQFDPRFSPPNPDAVKQLLNRLHLKAHSLHAPFTEFDGRLSEAEQKQVWLTQVKNSIDYAAAIGVDIVTVHPIFISQIPGQEGLEVVDCGEPLLQPVVRHARAQGVRIALENMRQQRAPQYAHTAQLKALIERLEDETVGICFDSGHALSNGADFSAELHNAGEYLITLHVNDNLQGDQDLHLVPDEGEIDWQQFLIDLQAIHYKGVFLMEIRGGANQEEIFKKIHTFLDRRLKH